MVTIDNQNNYYPYYVAPYYVPYYPYYPAPYTPGVCPGCGRCKQCGRPNAHPPYIYPLPYYGTTTAGNVVVDTTVASKPQNTYSK